MSLGREEEEAVIYLDAAACEEEYDTHTAKRQRDSQIARQNIELAI